MRIAINGFGRIGRTFLRTIVADSKAQQLLDVAVINVGPADIAKVAHMFKYDSIMRTFQGEVSYEQDTLIINNKSIKLIAISDSKQYDWKKYNIDWVVDASGKFASQELSAVHIDAGAQHALITAPCKGYVTTIVPGVNTQQFDKNKDKVVSLASCTTNALTPMLKVMHDAFQIEQGFMTTVHAYTNSQVLLDVEAKDVRRARAAALNIIPTSTGACAMVDQVMPLLQGKIQAMALRVPVADTSLIDLTVHCKKKLSVAAINDAFKQASDKALKGILLATDVPLVSSDYIGNPHSVIVDMPLTQASGNMCKLFGWYDNEWGYSSRLKDFLLCTAQ